MSPLTVTGVRRKELVCRGFAAWLAMSGDLPKSLGFSLEAQSMCNCGGSKSWLG